MAAGGLTGSRIREQRLIKGIRQAELARKIGISASYLNLIEHNRRRIGGKVLLDIAAALNVAPPVLTQGAAETLVANLHEAADAAGIAESEVARVEEFAGRFPGWADALARAHLRNASLERLIETLSDRMSHDPQLAESIYELLSTAAAIRSTSSILAETSDMDPDLQARFHGNMDADSARLADSAKRLVQFLDTDPTEAVATSPMEEVEAFLEAIEYNVSDVASDDDFERLLNSKEPAFSAVGRKLARNVLQNMRNEQARVSKDALEDAIAASGVDPLRIAAQLGVPVSLVFRRLASLPALDLGLVVCDRAGSLLFRKAARSFSIPRFGSACPLWPLFEALCLPEQVLFRRVKQVGRDAAEFDTFSVAESTPMAQYNRQPLLVASMLILPVEAADARTGKVDEAVGSTCRICPKQECVARREPSIL